ncbi:MAG: hypothetical protein WCK18_02985 [Prolixibacteraceae bacterium]
MKLTVLLILILSFCNCGNQEKISLDPMRCTVDPNLRFYSQNEMTAAFRNDVIEKLATSNQTDANGALDRNKTAYFHVRFQMGISPLADYAVDAQNSTALEMVVRAVEYSFKYQLQDGDFLLVIPPDLVNTGTATEGDRVSGTAFFYSALGAGLLALQENPGYQAQLAAKKRIEILIPQYQLSLNYLKSKISLLKQIDADAPNRLFFDALAFYSMGKYLNDKESMRYGIDFANLALAKKQPEGYFMEGSGFDSSYQGVGIAMGFRLLSILVSDEPIRQILYDNLACATRWEMTRIKPTGEITTDGNSRVYSGGETFLGKEKQVAYSSVLTALWNMYYYSGKEEYNDFANKVLAYYLF